MMLCLASVRQLKKGAALYSFWSLIRQRYPALALTDQR